MLLVGCRDRAFESDWIVAEPCLGFGHEPHREGCLDWAIADTAHRKTRDVQLPVGRDETVAAARPKAADVELLAGFHVVSVAGLVDEGFGTED